MLSPQHMRGSEPGVRRGGRKKGVPNKATTRMRVALMKLAEANVGKIQSWIDSVEDPAKRAALFLDLCEYCIPKLARTEVTGPDGGPLQIGVMRFSDPTPQQLDASVVSDARVEGLRTGLPPRNPGLASTRGERRSLPALDGDAGDSVGR